MSRRTKKVKISGRLGPRYGIRIRKGIKNIETVQRAKHECPQCKHIKVKRVAAGIWQCRKCNYKYAGGAYVPTTAAYKARKQVFAKLKESE